MLPVEFMNTFCGLISPSFSFLTWNIYAAYIKLNSNSHIYCYLKCEWLFYRRVDIYWLNIYGNKGYWICVMPLEPQQPLFEKVVYYGNSIDCVRGIRL